MQAPGILLKTDKYGAPFLVVGNEDDPTAIFLGDDHQFQSFKRGSNEHWSGLAIEHVEIEVDIRSAVDLAEFSKCAGMMIRRNDQLTMAVIDEGPFKRTTEIAIQAGLPMATSGEAIGFLEWRAVIALGEERVPVWQMSLKVSDKKE